MRLHPAAMLALAVFAAAPAEARPHDDTCVGWGIGGALIGVSAGFYGTAAVHAAATGKGLFDVPMPAVIASEFVGLVGGPLLFCNLFSPEASFVPEASWVAAGGSLGLAAGLGAGYGLLLATEPATAEDYVAPWRVLGAITLAAGGAFGGGWLGHRLFDEAHAGPVSAGLLVVPAPDALTLAMTGTF